MKKIYIYAMALLALVNMSCNETEDGVSPTDIINLTSESLPGSIRLNWEYPDTEKNIRYIEVRYFDPAKEQEVRKTASGFGNSILIEDVRLKYGEYKFQIQPFSTTFTPGTVHEIAETPQRAEIVEAYTSRELTISADDIDIPGIYSSSKAESLFDKDNATFVNFDYSVSTATGVVRYYDIHYPKTQEYIKFSYINRNHADAKFPSEIECYVKALESDPWTLVTTLKKDVDGLPTKPLDSFISKEYKAPFAFNYFRFRVPTVHTGSDVKNFSLAEFRIYEVEYYFFDPEA